MTIIGLSLASFVSCTKQDNLITPTQKVDVNRVVFASIEEYESLFEDPKTTNEKASEVAARFGTFNEAARVGSALEDTLYQEFLQKILNDDHVVQIDKWLIKVDAAKEQVLVLDKKYLEQYTDLANSNLENKNILVYSTNEDVLSLLQESQPSARTSGLFCKDNYASGKTADHEIYGLDIKLTYHLCYIKRGIYFEIYVNGAQLVYVDGNYVINKNSFYPGFTITKPASWELRCGKKDGISAGTYFSVNDNIWDGGYRKSLYSNVRALTQYDISLMFTSTNKELHIDAN